MTINLIVAVDRGNAIGWQDGRLPWHVPADMKRFKELTTGSTVIMGRKTFDSLQRPNGLPHRHNVVLTRGTRSPLEDIIARVEPIYANDLQAYVHAHRLNPEQHLWVIGGAEIYRQALAFAYVDKIYLTQIDTDSGADVKFPVILNDLDAFVQAQSKCSVEWTLEHTEHHQDDHFKFSFHTLSRSA